MKRSWCTVASFDRQRTGAACAHAVLLLSLAVGTSACSRRHDTAFVEVAGGIDAPVGLVALDDGRACWAEPARGVVRCLGSASTSPVDVPELVHHARAPVAAGRHVGAVSGPRDECGRFLYEDPQSLPARMREAPSVCAAAIDGPVVAWVEPMERGEQAVMLASPRSESKMVWHGRGAVNAIAVARSTVAWATSQDAVWCAQADGDVVEVGATEPNPFAVAVDESGQVLWAVRAPGAHGLGTGAVVRSLCEKGSAKSQIYSGDVFSFASRFGLVAIGGSQGRAHVIDAKRGQEVLSVAVGGTLMGVALGADGVWITSCGDCESRDGRLIRAHLPAR